MKKALVAAVLGAWLLSAGVAPAAAGGGGSGATVLVAPARYSVLQVLFDVIRIRPAVLVSYQGEPNAADPFLNVWNGREWLYVSVADFKSGAFLSAAPGRMVLFGGPDVLPAVLKEGAASGAPEVVEALDNASILNAMGRAMKFKASEWRWLAARYKMEILDANASRRKDSWYYHPWVEPPASMAPLEPASIEPLAEPLATTPDAPLAPPPAAPAPDAPKNLPDADQGILAPEIP
jgi:hypothetical protein